MKEMKKIGITIMLFLLVIGVKADDFGLWTGVGLGQNLGVKGLSAEVDLGFRANNHLRNVDRWDAGIGLGYTVCPYLKIGASYSFMYSYSGAERKEHFKDDDGVTWNGYNIINSFWRVKNRFRIDAKTGIDLGRFSISLRERYQNTQNDSATTTKDKYRFNQLYDADGNVSYVEKADSPEREPHVKQRKTKEYLRSRLEVSYNIRHCPLTPSVSMELKHNLRESFHLDGIRYTAEMDWKFSKQIHVGAAYHFDKGQDDDNEDDIHAIEVSLKLKNLFFKPKK